MKQIPLAERPNITMGRYTDLRRAAYRACGMLEWFPRNDGTPLSDNIEEAYRGLLHALVLADNPGMSDEEAERY